MCEQYLQIGLVRHCSCSCFWWQRPGRVAEPKMKHVARACKGGAARSGASADAGSTLASCSLGSRGNRAARRRRFATDAACRETTHEAAEGS